MKKKSCLLLLVIITDLFLYGIASSENTPDLVTISDEYFLQQTGLSENELEWFDIYVFEEINGYSVWYEFSHITENSRYLSILERMGSVRPFAVYIENGHVNEELSRDDDLVLYITEAIEKEHTFLQLMAEREALSEAYGLPYQFLPYNVKAEFCQKYGPYFDYCYPKFGQVPYCLPDEKSINRDQARQLADNALQQYVGISAEEIETFFVDESFCHHEQQQFFNYSWNFVYCTKEDDGFYHEQYGVIIRAPQNDVFNVFSCEGYRFDSDGFLDYNSPREGKRTDYYLSDVVFSH